MSWKPLYLDAHNKFEDTADLAMESVMHPPGGVQLSSEETSSYWKRFLAFMEKGEHAEEFKSLGKQGEDYRSSITKVREHLAAHYPNWSVDSTTEGLMLKQGGKKVFHPGKTIVNGNTNTLKEGVELTTESKAPPIIQPPKPEIPKTGLRAAFTGKKDALKGWAQENRGKAGVASVLGIGAGAVMTIDGFKRLRKGLGYNAEKDVQELAEKSGGVGQTIAGVAETAAGVGLAVIGAWTALVAAKGKGVGRGV